MKFQVRTWHASGFLHEDEIGDLVTAAGFDDLPRIVIATIDALRIWDQSIELL